ncbi:hypothetical protein OPIT5_21580 [Opitutaceae bacterium TAV5]|nr:hypothetical protein OPIT5_21580 [Opitutaceae bacterium TAV5]
MKVRSGEEGVSQRVFFVFLLFVIFVSFCSK